MSSVRVPLTVVPIGRVCGHGHRDRVHPGHGRRSSKRLDELQHRGGEGVPREVRLVAGEEQERLPERVVGERELEPRRPVVGQVVLVERDDGPARAVVEQHVVREDGERRRVELVPEVLDQLTDGAAGVGESRQRDDERQPARHRRRGRRRARTADRRGAWIHATSRAGRAGPARPAQSEQAARPGPARCDRNLGWRSCRFPSSSTAPPRSETPTQTRSCWRSRRSTTDDSPELDGLAGPARGR